MMMHQTKSASDTVLHWSLVLFAIIALGLSVRLWLAPSGGHGSDIGINIGWAQSAARFGVVHSYLEQVDGNMIPNYPPLSIAMFGGVGVLYQTFVSPEFNRMLPVLRTIIKLPAIFVDLLTALAFFFFLRKPLGQKWALLAAGAYAFHPSVIYESAVWGQTDTIFTFFTVLGLFMFHRNIPYATGFFMALALLSKPHAMIFGPLVLFLLLRDPRRLFKEGLVVVATMGLAFVPFVIGNAFKPMWATYVHSVGYYPTLASGAYNFWWSLYADAVGGKPDTGLFFNIPYLTYRGFGLLLFLGSYAGILWSFRRQLLAKTSQMDVRILFGAAALIAYAFFVFNTEMHERYLFPAMALGIPLLFTNRRTATLYVVGSIAFLWNLLGIVPFTAFDRALYGEFPALDVFVACTHVFVFIFLWLFLLDFQKTLPVPAKSTKHTALSRVRKFWQKHVWTYA